MHIYIYIYRSSCWTIRLVERYIGKRSIFKIKVHVSADPPSFVCELDTRDDERKRIVDARQSIEKQLLANDWYTRGSFLFHRVPTGLFEISIVSLFLLFTPFLIIFLQPDNGKYFTENGISHE